MNSFTKSAVIKFGLLLASALLIASGLPSQTAVADIFQANHKLGRGVNVLGYDPFWRSAEKARFKQQYFPMLRKAGFDSLRVNLYCFRLMSVTNNFQLPNSWFEKVDWILRNAETNGLMVILDLHEYGAMGQDPEANKPKFLAFWKQVGERYKNAPSFVYFELLNEPSKKLTPALWNEYLKEGLTVVRQTNPTRPVIIGPAYWNSVEHMRELELPDTDTNLILTVHYYAPMEFTHQGAAWTNQKDKTGVKWQGTKGGFSRIDHDFDAVAGWAREHQRPVLLGEFGAYDKAEMESRARYVAAVSRAAEQRGWSWAYWQFDSDFILYDVKTDRWVEPIRKALITHEVTAE